MPSKPEPRGLRRQRPHPAVPAEQRPPESARGNASGVYLANGKIKKSYYLERETVQRLKDATKGTASRVDLPDGISAMADAAINFYVDHLEREYNAGKPFPVFEGRSRRGPQG
ncbi:hypothetical protein [Tomitella cavernea]|uniref:Centromere-binding protein ParB C-terminal domain-containing protein n=1 Tax=Tomitella cavernea TaxID=1387982 RepID=A0ABP9D5Q0_9ACTN|nr:hypothetical protein [Tomitella cavernea]